MALLATSVINSSAVASVLRWKAALMGLAVYAVFTFMVILAQLIQACALRRSANKRLAMPKAHLRIVVPANIMADGNKTPDSAKRSRE